MKLRDSLIAFALFVVVTMIAAVVLGLQDTPSILVGLIVAGLFVTTRLTRRVRN